MEPEPEDGIAFLGSLSGHNGNLSVDTCYDTRGCCDQDGLLGFKGPSICPYWGFNKKLQSLIARAGAHPF